MDGWMDGWVGNGMHAYNNKYLARARPLTLSLSYIVIVIVNHFRDVLLYLTHPPLPPLSVKISSNLPTVIVN